MRKTIKMKPQDIVNAIEGLGRVIKAEDKFCEAKAEAKFSPKIALAIAKNRKVLEGELQLIRELQEKHEAIAEKTGKELKDLPEQVELMRSEMDVEIYSIPESLLDECRELTSADYYGLMFMTDETENEEKSEKESGKNVDNK